MRLLILNYEYPPLGGGAGRCAKYQAEGLAGLGHDVTVITAWFKGEKEMEQRDHFRLVRLKSWRRKIYRSNPLEMFSWALHSWRYIRRSRLYARTDLVLAHFALPGGMVALPLKLVYHTPYYIVSHGQDIPWFSPKELFLYHFVFYFPIKWICSAASKITVLSQRRLNDLNSMTSSKQRSKNLIIPNGCDIDFFTPPLEDKETAILRLLFVGRLTVQKDPFTLLEALQLLTSADIPVSLEIIGDGPLRRTMEAFVISRKLDKWVSFPGWIIREELREKYRNAHLLVITSRDEGQSLAMLEAISSGLYLFTTPVSGSELLVHENVNGTFIPPGEPHMLAKQMAAFYREKVSKNYRIPEGVLLKLRESISWENYVKAYHRIISQ
jgi:glycosyltransferase involved in cell wall biosynthesis